MRNGDSKIAWKPLNQSEKKFKKMIYRTLNAQIGSQFKLGSHRKIKIFSSQIPSKVREKTKNIVIKKFSGKNKSFFIMY